jgi:GrpB-like predicted nucleotidyltransferase (UPF0157 family)
LFEKEQQLVKLQLGDKVIDIQHIGSTSIHGIWAKPIIDLMGGLFTYPADKGEINNLTEIGYDYLGESGVTGRQYLRKRQITSYNLHLVQYEGEHWNNNLLFRDYLRANPNEARKYSQRKQAIIRNGVTTLLEYSDEKMAIIQTIMEAAMRWNNSFKS